MAQGQQREARPQPLLDPQGSVREEAAAGLPVHGEASMARYAVQSAGAELVIVPASADGLGLDMDALHAVADVCFDLLAERGIERAQVIALFLQLGEAAREGERKELPPELRLTVKSFIDARKARQLQARG